MYVVVTYYAVRDLGPLSDTRSVHRSRIHSNSHRTPYTCGVHAAREVTNSFTCPRRESRGTFDTFEDSNMKTAT